MAEPLLSAEGLTKAYGGVRACAEVELALAPGELRAVIGPNGAGKTTLTGLLAGELRPDAGRIRFAGREIQGLDAAARARAGIGRSYQITSLFPRFTALENARLAVQVASGHSFGFRRAAARDRRLAARAEALLGEVGLEARAAVPVGDLAHGEQRQLEIALALAGRPRLLLLDEPTAGMAPEESRAMVALLQRLRGGVTILLVEHDMDAVFALADRITVLVGGRVLATDRPDAIRANAEVQAAYLGQDGGDGAETAPC
ncbi:amino acid/amide ABC transporter ATP-binding protein 1, HAAT family [Tistlia consotensis]|uniref:Amino acid/amide ABC transporter ATP-binding protein 1, HAAT family n=1 Tax=Tistlia consotensis USBA 355 TaxID=560819 RepID=A0A1Y6BRZ7_9PROT|nr:ABC transporter ATP-binding protein [Tistlia consotensis]SMF24012.1 amino acid/amide ABC transporter ATP-binding protein 1, HAAT family [Tistlia consotensis USBA 355]SNR61007.1 amino acid/amide ABC transporter ATP-binding protein 1, HAAT family [Tistlia consotensis]